MRRKLFFEVTFDTLLENILKLESCALIYNMIK